MVISKVSHTGIDWQKGYYNCHFGWRMVGYLGCHVWTWLCSSNGESQNCIAPWSSQFLVGHITDSPKTTRGKLTIVEPDYGFNQRFGGRRIFNFTKKRYHYKWSWNVINCCWQRDQNPDGLSRLSKKVLFRLPLMVDFQSIVFVYFTVDYYSSQQTSFRIFDVQWLR